MARVVRRKPQQDLKAAVPYLRGLPASVPVISHERDFWESRPGLRMIRDYAWANFCAPWAVYLHCIGRAAASIPPEIVLPGIGDDTETGAGSLNLLLGFAGATNEGKGLAALKAARLMPAHPCVIERGGISSGQGLIGIFAESATGPDAQRNSMRRKAWNALVNLSEIDQLAGVSNQKGSITLAMLRQAWSGERMDTPNAEKDRNRWVPGHEYRLVMTASLQPRRAAVLLNDRDGGLPQRFAWAPVTDPSAPRGEDRPQVTPVPLETWPRRGWPEHRPPDQETNEHDISPQQIGPQQVISVCRKAREEVEEYQDLRQHEETDGTIDGHAMFTRLKIAAVTGFMTSPDTRMHLTRDDYDLSGVAMEKSDETRDHVIAQVAESSREESKARGRRTGFEQVAAQETIESEREKKIEHFADALHKTLKQNRGGLAGGDLRKSLNSRYRDWYAPARDRAMEHGTVTWDGRKYHAG